MSICRLRAYVEGCSSSIGVLFSLTNPYKLKALSPGHRDFGTSSLHMCQKQILRSGSLNSLVSTNFPTRNFPPNVAQSSSRFRSWISGSVPSALTKHGSRTQLDTEHVRESTVHIPMRRCRFEYRGVRGGMFRKARQKNSPRIGTAPTITGSSFLDCP